MPSDRFEQLVSNHKDAIYRQMVRVCGNADDAEDVLQEALLRAYKDISSLREPAAFRAWLARIGRNVCLRLRERDQLKVLLELPLDEGRIRSDSRDIEEEVLVRDLERRIHNVVGELPPLYREAFTLKDLDGLTYEEAASRVKIHLPAMKQRVRRARQMVREKLDPLFVSFLAELESAK